MKYFSPEEEENETAEEESLPNILSPRQLTMQKASFVSIKFFIIVRG